MAVDPVILALDTSTLRATAALLRGSRPLGEVERVVTTHSERLLVAIDELLRGAAMSLNQIDVIACGKGPGSFTGLRIGMSTAKGLSWATGKPLVCVSSLAALAANTNDTLPRPTLVVPCIDARRGEVFAGFHGADGAEPEVVLDPDELRARLVGRRPLLLGDGAVAYAAVFTGMDLAPDALHAVRAREVGRLALARFARDDVDDVASVEPTYLRASDAETGRKRR